MYILLPQMNQVVALKWLDFQGGLFFFFLGGGWSYLGRVTCMHSQS